ncbi:MAG: 5'-3' exonuclease [Anaerolineae bacterium]
MLHGIFATMNLYLVDGTYELFRNHFGAPPRRSAYGQQVGATVGMIRSLNALLGTPGVTHIAVAFDHVIESFRNELYAGYKTGAGVDPDLLAQFPLAEEAVAAMGIVVWPMVEFEADDALATAAVRFGQLKSVERVLVCSPDKDLAQLVARKVVCWDRRRELIIDEAAVRAKYGVDPASIPDWLALVGDAADGFPGIPGWGAKSAAAVLARYKHLEAIPSDPRKWKVASITPGRAAGLSAALASRLAEALLYLRLATLRTDVPLKEKLSDLAWRGARPEFRDVCYRLGDEKLPDRVLRWRTSR